MMDDIPFSQIDFDEAKDCVLNYAKRRGFNIEIADKDTKIWECRLDVSKTTTCLINIFSHDSGIIIVDVTPGLKDEVINAEVFLSSQEYHLDSHSDINNQIISLIETNIKRVASFYKVAHNVQKKLKEGGFEGLIKLGSPIKSSGELGFQYVLYQEIEKNLLETILSISSTSSGMMVRGRSHYIDSEGKVASDTIWNKLVVKSEDPEWVLNKIYEIPNMIYYAHKERNDVYRKEKTVYMELIENPGCYGENVIPLPLEALSERKV